MGHYNTGKDISVVVGDGTAVLPRMEAGPCFRWPGWLVEVVSATAAVWDPAVWDLAHRAQG